MRETEIEIYSRNKDEVMTEDEAIFQRLFERRNETSC